MAQQVFPQWSPVVKAHNEDQQEVYIPAAIIHAQTRDGKDELIVGAGNMMWTGSMWVPVSAQNRLPVEATLTGHTVDMATETTLAQSVDKLNSILSRLESKLDTAIFDSQGNPISAANRLPVDAAVSGTVDVSDRADRQLGKVALTGQIVEEYNGAEVVRTKEIGKAYRTHFFMDSEYVEVAAGAFVDDSEILSVNGFSTLAVLLRVQSTSRDIRVRARWYSGNAEPFAAGSAYEDLLEGSMQTGVATTDTKSPFVRLRIHNNSQTPDQFHLGVLLR